MTNCWSFTVTVAKHAKRWHWRVCGDGLLRIRAKQCTSTPSLQNGCIFGSQDARFHVPMLLSADTINIFISEPDFHHQSRVATDSASWEYPACTRDTLWCQHYVRTSKKYL